jgi:anti-anti-sigma factor
MTLHVSTEGDVVVVETSRGPITDWRKIEELNTLLRAQIDAGHKKILLELANTNFMTSLTIGVLVGIQVNAFKNGAALYLCNVTKRIRDTLLVLWLLRVLNVLDTREEAIAFLSTMNLNLNTDNFSVRVGPVERFSGHLTFSWPNSGSVAHVIQEACGGGFATLHVRDATNREVYTHNLADMGRFPTSAGKAGDWSIELDFLEYSGPLQVAVQRT